MAMQLRDAAGILHAFILSEYPDGGDPTECLLQFLQNSPNSPACTILDLERRTPEDLCKEFPHLFRMIRNGGGLLLLRASNNAHFAGAAKGKKIDRIAITFYNDCLKEDVTLRRACEDRNTFDQEFATWKEAEGRKGIRHVRCPPSAVIQSLQRTHKVVFMEKVDGEPILVWSGRGDEHGKKSSRPKNADRVQRTKEAARRVRNARADLERDRNGVEVEKISFGVDGGVVPVKEKLSQHVRIINRSPSDILVSIKSAIAERKGVVVEGDKSIHISSGYEDSIKVVYTPNTIGILASIIVFDISSCGGEDEEFDDFSITRYLTVHSGDPRDYEILKPTSPFKRKEKMERGAFSSPTRLKKEERAKEKGLPAFEHKLERYYIPKFWREEVENQRDDDTINELYFPDGLPEDDNTFTDYSTHLSMKNYRPIFHCLLWSEEAQMEVDIKNYDMANKRGLTKRGGLLYSLTIPGLAENRPSVLRGDKMFIRNNQRSFEGTVERVELEDAFIRLPKSFQAGFIDGSPVDVRFQFKRTLQQTAHQGIDVVQTEEILFPSPLESRSLVAPVQSSRLNLYNRDLNPEQEAAVLGVLSSVARPSPYLIYGPPGTGKTVTLVESILQTLKLDASSPSETPARLLVCAPSNMAADVLCERLSPFLSDHEMARVVAYSRDRRSVPEAILKYANFNIEEDAFATPPVHELKEKRVVIMTVATCGKNLNIGIRDHFTHVFMDEAGHAIEPEAIACLTSATKSPVVVLAGDPKQLGPIIRSEVAKSFGLETSFLERLSLSHVYERKNDSYDSRVCTKLVRNYRSHPDILKLPNELFYDNDLLAKADPFTSKCFEKWEHLPKKGFPLIFHGVKGEDNREGNSPSWFNSDEASVVKYYVELLIKGTKSNRCEAEEIGIITPYHKQAQKIRKLMERDNYDCKVGSVDEFQGSERRVIIISTVRSSVDHIEFDNRHRLGFLANPKRFNVAVTRAKSLLIVIGNPLVLSRDECWRSLIEHCVDNGGYIGCDYNAESEANVDDFMDDALKGIATMTIDEEKKDEGDGIDVSKVTAQEGPEWRFEE